MIQLKRNTPGLRKVALVKIYRSVRKPGEPFFSDDHTTWKWEQPSTGEIFDTFLCTELFNVYSPFDKSIKHKDVIHPEFDSENRIEIVESEYDDEGNQYRNEAIFIGYAWYVYEDFNRVS